MRPGPALAVAALALVAGCADSGDRAGDGAASPTSSPAALTVQATGYGALPLPTEPGALRARLAAMPDRLGDATRKTPGDDEVTYTVGAKEYGIQAAEVADLFREAVTPADAFDRMMTEQFDKGAKVCATPPARCISGVSDGSRTVVWGHDDSPLVLVALAPDASQLTALLQAWSSAKG